MKFEIQVTDKDKNSHNVELTQEGSAPNGLWKAPGASTISATGGGNEHSKWSWGSKDGVTLVELGYPNEPPEKVMSFNVSQFPFKKDDTGTGTQLARGVRIKPGSITWKCLRLM